MEKASFLQTVQTLSDQFDHLQQELKILDYQYDIPVLYYSELLCIALGLDIHDIIRKHHRIKPNSLFERIKIIQEKNREISEYFRNSYLRYFH